MQATSRVLSRLNIETRGGHTEADAPWLELMTSQPTRARYIDVLVKTYGYEAPIESALSLLPRFVDAVGLRKRLRCGLLVQDLLSLGLSPATIARLPQCPQIVPFCDEIEACGWIYAIERSTLVHENLHRYLAARLPHVSAWSYLSARDQVAMPRWRELGAAFERILGSADDVALAVAAAKDAFTCHREWFGVVTERRTVRLAARTERAGCTRRCNSC